MATINGVEVIGDKSAHDFDLLDKNDGINLANGVERNREATEDNHSDIVRHRTDTDVHVTPAWKNSLVSKETLGLYWTAAQTADIINEISIAGGAKLVKVEVLPETGKEQTIYLVPKTDPLERDIFDEFVWIDGKFEFIGTTKVDLSNYATKTELNAKANTSDLTIHTNNTDIHVTTADKNKWNGKQDALSNQQLSNIADVANKANNADVVHKSGDETISGTKTFSGTIKPKTLFVNTDESNNGFQCFGGSMAVINEYGAGVTPDSTVKPYSFYVGKGRNYANAPIVIDTFMLANGGTTLTLRSASNSETVIDNRINIGTSFIDGDTPSYLPYVQFQNTKEISSNANNKTLLGTVSYKWADVNTVKINGINPGALSLPSVSSGINLDLTNFKTDGSDNKFRLTNFSNYPYDNGWLFVRLNGCTSYYLDHWYKVVSNEYANPSTAIFFMPINDIDHDITLRCVCTSINHIRVFPCQGNV